MKSLKNMPENLEKMTDSVRLRPLFSVKIFDHRGNVLICLLINTSAPSHWLKSVAWPVGPVLKFRDIPDCSDSPFLWGKSGTRHCISCSLFLKRAMSNRTSPALCHQHVRKKPTKFAKTWGENVLHHMRDIFCEVTQRRDDEHSRTCRRLIQFNISCSKTHFLSDSQIQGVFFLFCLCFFRPSATR